MSLKSNIKNTFALTAVLFLFTACGGGSGSTGSSVSSDNGNSIFSTEGGSLATSGETTISTAASGGTTTSTSTTQTTKVVHSGQVKDSTTGNGLPNVKVTLGESSTKTDDNGFYTLPDLTETEEAVINFEKEGYLLSSTLIQLKSLSGDNTTSSNYLEYNMYTHDYQWDHESTKEILSSRIAIDASIAYKNTLEKPYSGTMAVELTILDNDEEAFLASFPGEFKGINTNGTRVQFESYGLISIFFKDSNGNKLSLQDGETAALTFNAISSLENTNTLPLWYYDYDQGVWIEEGYAELQEDGSYRGEISHLGTWSLNKPLEDDAGIYRGRIISEDGSPMSDVRLQAIGENWISHDLSTDEDGVFEIEVIPGKSFKLTAYNYKDKYKASYNNTISAIASGDIVED